MTSRKSALLVAPLLLSAMVALPGCDKSGAAPLDHSKPLVEVDPPAVSVITVQAGDLEASLAISGSLSARSRVAVTPKATGRLERVLVDIGDRVREGQVVAIQDTRELDAQLDAAQASVAVSRASLEQAEAALSNATLERDRAKNLFEKGALAKQRLDAADTANRSATAQRSLAQAMLQQAEASMRRAQEVRREATLTAPTGGVVVERNYDAGALVGPGDTRGVVVVADTSELKLDAGVAEFEAGRLRVGMTALVAAQARPGQSWPGRVVAVAPEVDERNRHFHVEVRVQNPRDELISGMYAVARIETGHADKAVLVPREAVATREGARVVYRVANEMVTPVTVTEGLSDDRRVQLIAGLSAGDVIVADARKPIVTSTRVRAIALDSKTQ